MPTPRSATESAAGSDPDSNAVGSAESPAAPATQDAAASTPVADRYVLIAGHVLFAVLLVIGAVRAAAAGPIGSAGVVAALVVAAVTAAWYVAGAVWIAGGPARTGRGTPGRRDLPARVWLAGLLVLWLVLVALSAEFIWLAFLLAMLVWHLLPVNAAAPLDVAVAVVTVTAFAWHQSSWQVGAVIGPIVGIASAVVMTEIYQRLRAQSEERRRLLDELVRTQAALAEREHEAGRLAERERLAADIHDTVGQSLSSVILLLRAALADSDGARRNQLQTALDGTLSALGETRRLVRGLAPEAIENNGLQAALASLAEETSALGTPASLHEHGDPRPLDRPAEVALLRAAQEAVTNARKHADSSAITMTLTYQDDEASIDIVDDGRGFAQRFPADAPSGPGGPGAAAPRDDGSGYGLTAMRARIADCGGTVDVESEPGGGTAVRATVPIAAADREHQ